MEIHSQRCDFKFNTQIIKEYEYDNVNRVTKDKLNNHDYSYDKLNNITFTTQNDINEIRKVNEDNEYTQITNTNIKYDANGKR